MAEPTLITWLRNGWEQSTGEASVGRLPLPVLLGVLCVALTVWVAAHRDLPWRLWSGDACEYAEMGRRLAAGEGFTTGVIYPAEFGFGFTEEHPAVMRPPLWPLALAAVFAVTGPSDGAAHAITGAFFLGTVALTAILGAALGGPVAGAIAGLALATTPAFAGLALDAVSETPFAFFVTLAFLLTLRRGHAFAIGLTCGLAYLTRYNGLLLFPVLLALLWASHPRAMRPLLWCSAGLALVVLPWWLRNLWLTGNPVYSLLNLNLYFSPFVTGMHDSLYYVLEPDFDSAIAMHPVAKLQRQLPELIASWPLASLNLAACIGVLLACARGHWPSVGFAALAIGTTLAVAFGLPQGRYFVPFLPLLLALGASGWTRYGGRLAAPALALLLLAPALALLPRTAQRPHDVARLLRMGAQRPPKGSVPLPPGRSFLRSHEPMPRRSLTRPRAGRGTARVGDRCDRDLRIEPSRRLLAHRRRGTHRVRPDETLQEDRPERVRAALRKTERLRPRPLPATARSDPLKDAAAREPEP